MCTNKRFVNRLQTTLSHLLVTEPVFYFNRVISNKFAFLVRPQCQPFKETMEMTKIIFRIEE